MNGNRNARLGFAGTPDFAAAALRALITAGLPPVVVYTQPDRPAGRGRQLQPSPVKRCAENARLALQQPLSLRDGQAQQDLADYQLDLLIVAAYGLLLPPAVLTTPRLGCVNIHASLLPRWRGAAPIQRALLAGDRQTGISLMQMDRGLDTGPVFEQRALSIRSDDSAGSLHDRLAELGAALLIERLPALLDGTICATPQQHFAGTATYAAKLSKQEALLDWRQSAVQLDRCVRAYRPWPVAFTELQDGSRVRVLAAKPSRNNNANAAPGTVLAESAAGIIVACGADGADRVALTELQLAGKKPQLAAVFCQSRSLLGQRLQSPPS